jgi:endonuclease YncB( thermonuclease family)
VIAARIHPGIAALAVVASLTAVRLIVQTVSHKSASQPNGREPPISRAVPAQAQAPSAQSLSGIARVIDGDTIDVRGTHIRLDGIDAP